MADITADVGTWSSTAGSNQPQGTTNVGTGLDDNLRAVQAALKAYLEPLSSVAGTNTITATMANLTAYFSGLEVSFIPANTNTAAATINITSLGAKNIFMNGAALAGYELKKNSPVKLHYDGTKFNVISGAYGGDGVPTGTIKDRGAASLPNGYLLCDGSAVSRTTYADLFGVISTTWGVGDGATTFNLPDLRGRTRIGNGTGTVAETVAAGSVDTVNDRWTVASNNSKWITGMAVVLTTSGVLPAGLSLATTYYLVRESATQIKFATSLANAQNGTVINITDAGTGNHTLTHTLTARSLAEVGGEEGHAMRSSELLAHTHGAGSLTVTAGTDGLGALKVLTRDVTDADGVGADSFSVAGTTSSTGGNAAMNIMQPFAATMAIIKY